MRRWAIAPILSTELRFALIERELAYPDQESFELALSQAREAAEARPGADNCYRAALLLCCRGEWVEALPLLDKAIASRADFMPAYAERGLLYGLNEQYAEAMRDLAYAIHTDPSYHRSWSYRAALHVQRGLWGDVIDDASRAIRRAPAYAPPYKLRAIGYQVYKRPTLAAADLRAYLEHCPHAPDQAQISQTIANLEAPPPPDKPGPGGWFSRLFGRS